jgi:hypothetical protein
MVENCLPMHGVSERRAIGTTSGPLISRNVYQDAPPLQEKADNPGR